MADNKYGASGAIGGDSDDWYAQGEAHFSGWRVRSRWHSLRGRPEPVKIEIAGALGYRPITAQAVRELPLGEMLAETRRAIDVTARAAGQALGRIGDVASEEKVQEWASTGPQRGQALTPDDLAAVAAVYRRAWADGVPVNEAVRTAFHLTKGGADKRISRARRAGLLDGVGRP